MAKYNRSNIKLNDYVTLVRGVHSGRNGRVTKVFKKMCVVVLGDKSSLSVRKSLRLLCKVSNESNLSTVHNTDNNTISARVEVTPEKELKSDHLSHTNSSTRRNNSSNCVFIVDKSNSHMDFDSVRDSFSVASGYSSVSDEATIPYLEYDGLPKTLSTACLIIP